MIVRDYTKADYPILAEWWTTHNFPSVPEPHLPARGLVIENTAAVFIYHDPTAKLAGLEWWLTNPNNPPLTSARAIQALTSHANALKPTLGITHYFTTCKQPSLARLLQACDWTLTDQSMLHLLL